MPEYALDVLVKAVARVTAASREQAQAAVLAQLDMVPMGVHDGEPEYPAVCITEASAWEATVCEEDGVEVAPDDPP